MANSASANPSSKTRVLDQITVLDPCPMSWDKMVGDDKVRFCSECQRNVWNFFEMTDSEVVEVLRTNPGRLCAQIVKTRGGGLVTRSHRVRHERKATFRFSMLGMMIFATILSPLLLIAPGVYHWLVPQPTAVNVDDDNLHHREGGIVNSIPDLQQLLANQHDERARSADTN